MTRDFVTPGLGLQHEYGQLAVHDTATWHLGPWFVAAAAADLKHVIKEPFRGFFFESSGTGARVCLVEFCQATAVPMQVPSKPWH